MEADKFLPDYLETITPITNSLEENHETSPAHRTLPHLRSGDFDQ